MSLKKLFALCAFVSIAMLGGLILEVLYESRQMDHFYRASVRTEEATRAALQAKYHIVQVQQFLTDASLTGEMDSVKDAKENLQELDHVLTHLSELVPETEKEADVVRKGANELSAVGLEMVAAYLDHGKAAGDAIMKRKVTGLDERSDALGKAMDTVSAEVSAATNTAAQEYVRIQKQMGSMTVLLATLVGLLVSGVMFALHLRLRPIYQINQRLELEANEIRNFSQTLDLNSETLAETSSRQASAAQETAASLEEINSMISKTADNAIRMRKNAESGNESVLSGKTAVQEMLTGVEEIRVSNQAVEKDVESGNQRVAEIVQVISEIGNKTKVINDIVFQTKLLSFNASVEAARAGEHGKGFAVVAEEVGNLAEMSGKAAREISEMLTTGVERVQSLLKENRDRLSKSMMAASQRTEIGAQTAGECGNSFESIVGNVNEFKSAAQEISEAIDEQRKGLDEINKALNEFERSTQANAQSANEASMNSKGLLSRANQLRDLMLELKSIVNGEESTQSNQVDSEPRKHLRDVSAPAQAERSAARKVA